MADIGIIFLLGALLALIVILFMSFLALDKLVKLEYSNCYDEWLKDGKPRGFFWWPPESSAFASSFAMQRLSFLWLFRTPPWVSDAPGAIEQLKRLRLFVLTWNVGLIMLFVIAMLSGKA